MTAAADDRDAAGETDGPVVLYDGVCGLCDRSVQLILRNDRRGRFRFAATARSLHTAPVAAEEMSPAGEIFRISFDVRFTQAAANDSQGFRWGVYDSSGTPVTAHVMTQRSGSRSYVLAPEVICAPCRRCDGRASRPSS